jgi:hypothetical protein
MIKVAFILLVLIIIYNTFNFNGTVIFKVLEIKSLKIKFFTNLCEEQNLAMVL